MPLIREAEKLDERGDVVGALRLYARAVTEFSGALLGTAFLLCFHCLSI
eukprot:SAG22_NODE_5728_length_963_cov_1.519676_2_plen_49_part_00